MSLLSELTGQDDRRNARRAGEAQQRLIDEQQRRASEQYAFAYPGLQEIMTGLLDRASSFDPNDPSFWGGRLTKFRNANDAAFDSAAAELTADSFGRGIAGSSSLTSGLANLREDQAIQSGSYARDLMLDAEAEQGRRWQTALSPFLSSFGIANGLTQDSIGGLGGLQNMYQSNSNAALGNLMDLATLGAGLPPIGKIFNFGRRGAGNNTLGTNQVGSPAPRPGASAPFGMDPGANMGAAQTTAPYSTVYASNWRK